MNETKFTLNYSSTTDSPDEQSAADNESELESDGIEQSDDDDEASDIGETNTAALKKKVKKFGPKSELDDKFFKESDMEEFIKLEEQRDAQKLSNKRTVESDDEIDYFNGDLSASEDSDDQTGDGKQQMYNDFFEQDEDDTVEEDRLARKKAHREERNKLKEKLKKEELGLEDSDIDPSEEDSDAERAAGDAKVRFDVSKNSYISASENGDDDDDEDDETTVQQQQPNDEQQFGESQIKSSFEQRQERLRLRINDLEDKAMGEKSWQLKGEVDSASRPQNSLLEEVLNFDSTTRPAPIITEETTLKLEDIIRQRIKDKAWNDVEQKFKPKQLPQEFRKKLVLDQEKSKESLAQIYEKEFVKETERRVTDAPEKPDEEPKAHTDIRTAIRLLFVKLDALSNFYYTPKPMLPEAKIITNMPAINMEEVAPVSASDAMLLAPEEIKTRLKGDLIGMAERTGTDKKRERRHKKIKQKVHKIAKEKREVEMEKSGKKPSAKQENGKLLAKVTKDRNVSKVSAPDHMEINKRNGFQTNFLN